MLALVTLPAAWGAYDSGPIKVGAYASLTGKEAAWGQSYRNGALLALEEVNGAGGVNGRLIELVIEDDQSKSGESATAVRKLISRDKVSVVLGEVSSTRSLEAAPVCQQSKIPMISAGSNPRVTEMGNYIFRVAFIDSFQGTVMATFTRKKLGLKKVALLTDVSNAYSVGLAKYFRERFEADGGSIVIEQKYNGGEKDFKAQLTAIKAATPEALFVPGYYTEVGLIIAQARQLGISLPITGGDGWPAPQLAETAGNALENTYYCDNFTVDWDNPPTQAFIKKYRNHYHEDPDDIAPHGYDSIMIIADCVRRTGSSDPAKIREALATLKNFPGVSGNTTVDEHRNVTKPAFIMTYKGGQYKFVEAILP